MENASVPQLESKYRMDGKWFASRIWETIQIGRKLFGKEHTKPIEQVLVPEVERKYELKGIVLEPDSERKYNSYENH